MEQARSVTELDQSIANDDAAALELEAALSTFERLGAAAAARHATERLHGRADTTTATFLFTDVCGSTSLVEAIGNVAWLDLIEWHDRTLRSLFEEHRGEEIDHAGDGFFVAFHEPAPALACSVAIQRELARHRREHGFGPPVRIGVHMTDAIPAGGGYRGKGVHAAARVAAVAEANEIVASRATADAAGARFVNPRVVSLKGLSEPVEIVSVDWT